MENKVSVWLGKIPYEERLDEIICASYTADGDFIPSVFMKAFQIESLDHDFQEAFFSENIAEDLVHASYGESFASKISITPGTCNAVFLFYDFAYSGAVTHAEGFDFMGVFDYKKRER